MSGSMHMGPVLPSTDITGFDTKKYKAEKEAFVSNLAGGTITEINYVTALAPVAIIVWSILQSRQHFFKQYGVLAFLVDFALNVGAILLGTTLYSSMPLALILLLLVPTTFTYLIPAFYARKTGTPPWAQRSEKQKQTDKANKLDDLPMKPFLTTYRGCMMVITCIAILAVDFRIFPRRFAKVENWGTSLMDLGVGSFVFAAGVVAARPVLKERLSAKRGRHLGARLYASMRHSLPLLVLGVIRLYSVKGLDYAEHVTEYGVHWNFFFTLALLPPFVALFQSAFEVIPSYAALAILLGAVYEIVLNTTDLKAYILTAPRTDLISKNREGIFSFLGYLSIFLAGQSTGLYVIPRRARKTGPPDPEAQRMSLIITLVLWSVIWTSLYAITTSYYTLNLTVSRRLANLPYFLWVSAFNCTQLTAFCCIETWFFPAFYKATDAIEEKRIYEFATSNVLKAFNRNGLAVFLVANLATGIVNMTVKTLHTGDVMAMAILGGYSLAVTLFAVGLDRAGISIKL